MIRRLFLLTLLMFSLSAGVFAQRPMDKLDRGLVAMNSSSGVYCSWRIFGEEYYDVTYNIYRDGAKINNTPLTVSNYTDTGGSTGSRYTVAAVVRGVEQAQCTPVSVWGNNYMDIKLQSVYDGTTDITSQYEPNDVSVADLDGDGVVELLVKRKNTTDADNLFAENDKNFDILEAYKLDGTRLWWIDCGPNMVSGSSVEINIVAYDWDGDGKAEVLLRGADGMVLHKANGTTQTIGDASVNTRNTVSHSANMTYTNTGSEYLLYLNGQTAEPYQVLDYPLTRGNASDWGDGYGHRSSKYFFGAPFLDGRKPSIFLARGIYTRHKMIAYDVDASTHTLTKRWYWENLDSGSPWYGQGYHNYGIADVDWDGRDEIVYGSMVIDDNGYGLSTTGLGHGDAQHCSDFNPYVHGQEIFACNEDNPSNNYRDATTSKIYYRQSGGNDDGRSIMGNFTDLYPGSQGVTAHDATNLISAVTNSRISGSSGSGIDENFGLYWDGDLLQETFNYSGFNTTDYYETGNPRVYKYGKGAIYTFADGKTCNGTKGTPSCQADILGDWREEVILRTDDGNLRLYTTNNETKYRNYTLWHDMQYRQAMVWEMCGYNQPPHTSYFLGQLEGITSAPPALTMTNRTEIANGSTIGSATNDKQIIMAETNDMTVNVSAGASPYIFFDNAPSWVQGHTDNNNITTTYYTHTLTGGAFGGGMRLVKQGDGILTLPAVTQAYTGNTEVWAGTINFDGEMQGSRVWLNRFAVLNSNGGKFDKGIEMNYASVLRPGGNGTIGTVTADSLILNFGSVVEINLGSSLTADKINVNVLKIEKKVWPNGNGPEYDTPVMRLSSIGTVSAGKYDLGAINTVDGDINNIAIEGFNKMKKTLSVENKELYLTLANMDAEDVTWTGSESGTWDFDNAKNFVRNNGGDAVAFVSDDNVTFNDNATSYTVNVSGNIAPKTITFDNTKTYTLTGDSIVGEPVVTKNNTGNVIIKNENRVGNTTINGGKVTVSSLANTIGKDYGSLGNTGKTITINNGATLSASTSLTTSQKIVVGGTANLDTPSGVTMTMGTGISSTSGTGILTKTGSGALTLTTGNSMKRLIIASGTVNDAETSSAIVNLPDTVEFQGGTLYDTSSEGSYSSNNAHFVVPAGKTGTLYQDPRCVYYGKLTGAGTFNVYAGGVRNYLQGDWSAFAGTVVPGVLKRGTYAPSFDFNNTYGLPNATLMLNSGVTVNNDGKEFPIGKVSGSGTLAGTGAYSLVGDGDFYLSANTTSSTPLIKKGAGKMTILSLGRILGSLEIKEGTLQFYQSSATTAVSGSTATASGAGQIVGCGLLPSLIMTDNAQLTPCSYTSDVTVGTIKTNLLVRTSGNATINFIIASKSGNVITNSMLQVGTSLICNGVVNVTMLDTYTPAAGDSICLWTANSYQGTPKVNLPSLPSGLEWDTSSLAGTVGVLKIKTATGIASISANDEVECEVYTVGGVNVGSLTTMRKSITAGVKSLGVPSGTYIVKMRSGNNVGTQTVNVK